MFNTHGDVKRLDPWEVRPSFNRSDILLDCYGSLQSRPRAPHPIFLPLQIAVFSVPIALKMTVCT